MSRVRITDRTLSKQHDIPPDQKRIELWDNLLPGFGVRVTGRGVKSYFVVTRLGRQKIRVTLGKYPALPLADARDKAREVLESAMGGVDPRRTTPTAPKTIEALIEEFERRHLPNLKPKTQMQYRNALKNFAQRFKGRDPVTINKREVRAMLDDMVDDGTPIHANRNLAVVRKLFNWAVERGILDVSPCYGLKAPSKEKQRTRFLCMAEIKSLWSVLDTVHPIQSAFVRTLLLTGQRRETVATMRRSNIENGVWTIPREKMKGDRTHSIPLPSQLIELIDILPRQGDEDIVFTHDGRSTFSGYSKLKQRLDEAAPMDEWRYHDLRRTAGTHIARLGFQRLVVSKILGHVESGVTQIYELHSYDEEKKTALQAWADEVFWYCGTTPSPE
ncbi:MAG: tyrosine-type recombinase/integrase [Alphaproteobacteria bacterium]|nr:tyrosine-type recombinase/integrase [Alphaproteobacteria bacterium]MBU2083525.1 tyrosine-type recombinase/integrase [Alphaproteobacteria bacterium]MBU2143509.1 tyrosine-type recombinase/integrase [Alphaproteobacteria bacterium]MBU2196090.1 tyrosine-type recombinase/integrase [Alphaproteobacteria bacterium]